MLKWQAAKCFDNHVDPQRRDLNFEQLYLHISTCRYRALESVSNIPSLTFYRLIKLFDIAIR